MLTAVSGMLTKQGVSVSGRRSAGPAFASADVVRAGGARDARGSRSRRSSAGTARVAGYTVLYDGDRPTQTIALCDTGDGARAVAVGEDPGARAGRP